MLFSMAHLLFIWLLPQIKIVALIYTNANKHRKLHLVKWQCSTAWTQFEQSTILSAIWILIFCLKISSVLGELYRFVPMLWCLDLCLIMLKFSTCKCMKFTSNIIENVSCISLVRMRIQSNIFYICSVFTGSFINENISQSPAYSNANIDRWFFNHYSTYKYYK